MPRGTEGATTLTPPSHLKGTKMIAASHKTDPKLLNLLAETAEKVRNMSDDDYSAMMQSQRESWVRGNMPTGNPRFD